MGISSQRILLALAGLLCLLSHGFGSMVPMDSPIDDLDMPTIDEILMNAGKHSVQSTDPYAFFQNTHLVRRELDIIMTWEEYLEMKHSNRQKRTAAIRPHEKEKRWTNKLVSFEIQSGTFNARDMDEINMSLKEISYYTCLQFNETSEAPNRVYIERGFGGCYSYVGMIEGVQSLGLDHGCRGRQTIIHELLHAIGIHHEQTRPDRDDHVSIRLEHINDNQEYNFEKYGWNYINTFNISYDYNSVMHYGKKAFSETGEATIVTKDPRFKNVIGTNPGLSYGDIRTLNKMYSCVPESCDLTDADCGENGFVGKDCKCWCPGPKRNHPAEYCFEKDIKEKGSLDLVHECRDHSDSCLYYVSLGYCKRNPRWMLYSCEKSCNIC